ncbi:hypothetical protein ANCCAN_00859 [Ancylostoma caninum]|uniref:Peptidase A1 domain-containing protein n=1 Tax=Ancylostoma caninum TaxID=29170 RepID=A0A368H8G4_ANCCA|nr:hypothetical protein ANCCAN_00859 [Ancylostoma caninum]
MEMLENGTYADLLRELSAHHISSLAGNGAIVYDMHDFQYSQKITVGEPQQQFLVWISTGVSVLWIPHNNCTAPACQTKNKFMPEKSSTFKPMSTEFKIRCYGGVVTGVHANDQIRVTVYGVKPSLLWSSFRPLSWYLYVEANPTDFVAISVKNVTKPSQTRLTDLVGYRSYPKSLS